MNADIFDIAEATDLANLALSVSQPGPRPEFVPLKNRGIPLKLLTADAILKDACGTGFDAISAVLAIAATWTPGDAVTQIRRAELCDAVTRWSALSRAEIEAAVNRLTLAPDQLRQDEMRYWEQEKRSHRLAIRPLIRLGDDELLLIPRRLEATQGVFAAYLLDGRLPWPASDLPRRVIDAFINYRKTQNRQLEQETGRILTQLQLLAKNNIMPRRPGSA